MEGQVDGDQRMTRVERFTDEGKGGG